MNLAVFFCPHLTWRSSVLRVTLLSSRVPWIFLMFVKVLLQLSVEVLQVPPLEVFPVLCAPPDTRRIYRYRTVSFDNPRRPHLEAVICTFRLLLPRSLADTPCMPVVLLHHLLHLHYGFRCETSQSERFMHSPPNEESKTWETDCGSSISFKPHWI